MTTEVLGSAIALQNQRLSSPPEWDVMLDRATNLLQPLMAARNSKHLRRLIDSTVIDYVPVKSLMVATISAHRVEYAQTSGELTNSINTAIFDELSAHGEGIFSPSDKIIFLNVLKSQAEFVNLVETIPPENKPAFVAAFFDGYWAIQKIDICVTAILCVVSEYISPQHANIIHWLCLAMRRYLKEWQSALFLNSPALHDRLLRRSPNLISHDDMRQRLGLPD